MQTSPTASCRRVLRCPPHRPTAPSAPCSDEPARRTPPPRRRGAPTSGSRRTTGRPAAATRRPARADGRRHCREESCARRADHREWTSGLTPAPGSEQRASADHRDEVAGLDDIANGHTHLADGARYFGQHRNLHLHRLQQHQGVALADLIALVNNDLEHTGYDLGANILGHLHPFLLLYAVLSNHNTGWTALWQGHETMGRKYKQTEDQPWPSEAARNATVSIQRQITESAPTPRGAFAVQPRMIVVRLISIRSRSRNRSGAFSPLHLAAIRRLTRSSTP